MSDPQNWQQVKEIFEGALERHGVEREEYLDHECAGHTELREEVESLLRSYEVAGSFMESPAVAQAAEYAPESSLTVTLAKEEWAKSISRLTPFSVDVLH